MQPCDENQCWLCEMGSLWKPGGVKDAALPN